MFKITSRANLLRDGEPGRVEGEVVAEDSWKTHIGYLEGEVRKMDERADKLEALIPALKDAQKQHALRMLLKQLRDEGTEHRKYLALVKES